MYDVVIVGGGPSGLSGALVLGRCLRSVLVCDSGSPRNHASTLFNGFLSRDGSDPREFLTISREQLRRYETVELREAEVRDIRRGDRRFEVILAGGVEEQCRMVLLASGLVDELPAIEGLAELYGKSVHSCPYCHAWENRGGPMAVIGNDQAAADLAIELLLWTKDLVLCTEGELHCDEVARRQLGRGGVKIDSRRITRLESDGVTLKGLRFEDGAFLPRASVYVSPLQHQRSPLAERMGCEILADNCIQCGEDGATCVPGLYAVGNASRGVQLVIEAAAEGTRAAVAINNALIEADAEAGALGKGH